MFATLHKDFIIKLRDVPSALLDFGLHVAAPVVGFILLKQFYGQPKETFDEDLAIVLEFSICGVVFVSFMMSTISLMTNMMRDKSSGIKEVLNANG